MGQCTGTVESSVGILLVNPCRDLYAVRGANHEKEYIGES